jgi:hypothetical protein
MGAVGRQTGELLQQPGPQFIAAHWCRPAKFDAVTSGQVFKLGKKKHTHISVRGQTLLNCA